MKIANPGKHGFDPRRLTAIDAFVKDRYLDPGHLPHAQLLIARDDQTMTPEFNCVQAAGSAQDAFDAGPARTASRAGTMSTS